MKKSTRYVLMGVSIITWMMVSGSFVFAQNYSGVIPVEPISVNADGSRVDDSSIGNVGQENQQYPDVVLVPSILNGDDLSLRPELDPSIIVESSNYTLGKADVIKVIVLRHPEVSGEFVINNEGTIQYAFIGDIKVEGLKKDEIEDLLTKSLLEYIVSPNVIVQITGFNSKVVYVIGEVRRPGKIYMYGDTMTVRNALIQAGLPLLTGKLTKSRLITPSDTGKIENKGVNVHKLLYEGDLRENLVMKPGDTLYIPPTAMTKAMRVIQPVTRPLNSAMSTGRRVYTGGF